MKKHIVFLMLTAMLLSGLNAYAAEPVPGISSEDNEQIERAEESNLPSTEELEPDSPESTTSEAIPTNPLEELPGEPEPEETFPPTDTIPDSAEPEPENPIETVPPVIGESTDQTGDAADTGETSEEIPSEDEIVVGMSEEEKSIFDAGKVECSTSMNGFIDPCNIEGKGQMRFDDIVITNHNDMAVEVLLEDFNLEEKGGIKLVSEKSTNDTLEKWVMMYLSSSDTRTPYFTSETNSYHFGTLAPGETLRLKLDGAVNGCSTRWSENDQINLSFHFEFTPLER